MTAPGARVVPAPGDPPCVMGVLNATPDSFSGDGLAGDPDGLVARGCAQAAAGADLLDVGGESTRPGATPVAAAEELARVGGVVQRLAQRVDVPLSIDTRKPAVADVALRLGAVLLNDVSGLADPGLARVAADHRAWLVVTHNGWTTPRSRPGRGIVGEVVATLARLADQALAAGVAEGRLIVDPGLGFGKSPAESLELLRRTAEIRDQLAPLPLLVGPSRKGFVGQVLGLPPDQRLEGTLACVAIAAFRGAAIVRVHDVLPAVRVARMAWAVRQAGGEAPQQR